MARSWHRRRRCGVAAETMLRFVVAGLLLCSGAVAVAAIQWQAPVTVAQGAGQRGAWQQNDSHYDFVDDPAVAWSRRGELALAWVDQRRKAVLLQRYAADGSALPRAPVDVSRSPATFSWLPRLVWAPDDDQRLYVIWQEIVFSGGSHGGEVFFAVSRDGGRSFDAPVNLSNSRPGDGKGRLDHDTWHNGSLDLAAGPGGQVFAAWTEYDGRLWFSRSVDGGARFARPRLLAGEPPALPARAPALAVGPGRALVLAWTTGEAADADIQLTVSADAGASFSAPRPVAATAGRADAPKLAFDAQGGLHLVHAESRAASRAAAVHHLRSTDGGRSFGPAQLISQPLPPGYAGAGFPAIGIDARGRVVVTWELLRGSGRGATPYGLAAAVSANGVQFEAPQMIPGSSDAAGGFNGSSQGLLMNKLAVRGDGELAVVNSALKPGAHSRVWLLRGRLR